MSNNGFTKTTIIDCPRSQSQEAITFNNETPNLWTNRVGDGIKLRPGDQISVHSSYISEIGAQSGEIQIKGSDLNQDQTVEQTDTQNYLKVDYQPGEYSRILSENKTQTVPVRDDTLNFIFSPYKTANAENYMFLPRRFGSDNGATGWQNFDQRDGGAVAADMGATLYPPNIQNRCKADLNLIYHPYSVSAAVPVHKISGKNDNSRFTIYRAKETWFSRPQLPEVVIGGRAVVGSAVITVDDSSSTRDLIGDPTGPKRMTVSHQSPTPTFPAGTYISSFTDKTVTLTQAATVTTGLHNQFTFKVPDSASNAWLPETTLTTDADTAESLRDPATFNEYEQVRDLVSLQANPGYNSPSDLSVQLTEELNKRKDLVFPTGQFRNASNTLTEDKTVSLISETPAYKHYRCATANNFQQATYNEWEKTNNTWNIDLAYSYISAFHHIGIKRPEIYNAGVKMSKNASYFSFYLDKPTDGFSTDSERFNVLGDKVFNTGMEWNEQNLLNIKQFLDSQAVYPELFDDYTQSDIPVNSTYMRMIHINLFDNENSLASPSNFGANIKNPKTPNFGYDLYQSLGAGTASQTSFPMFIDYNPNTAHLTGDQVDYTTWAANAWIGPTLPPLVPNFNSLAYGFARKIRVTPLAGTAEQYVIGFQFEGTNDKIPEFLFHKNASYGGQFAHLPAAVGVEDQLGSGGGRQWGFDYHFTAYGTLALLLHNGNVNIQATSYDQLSIKTHPFAQQKDTFLTHLDPWQYGIYLGADSPIINYDEAQQRFEIESLHTSETVGNVISAGRSDNVVIPTNPDAALKCYKINKRPLGNSYTPEVTPYNTTFSASFSSASVDSFVGANECITPYRIFDAHSGLFIEDWIMPENYWDETLVGIMGFRYDQFHNPNSLSSRQVRIRAFGSTNQLNNVNVITTNAKVDEGDLIDYSKNLFSTNNFDLANVVGLTGEFHNSGAGRRDRNMLPAVTVKNAESVKITAKRIPTKTLRPYYTIRSDIILENNYLGGDTSGITLPVVAITNKANPYGDFLNGIGGEIVFTNTVDRTITDIRCSIHEPDGSAARCDKNSSVIFKIDQQIAADMNVVDTLLQSKKKSDQIAAQEAEGVLPDYDKIKYSFE